MLTRGDLAAGLAVLAAVLAACALVAWRVERRWFRGLRGAPRLLGLAVTFTAALLAVQLVPGLAGVLTPLAVLAVALAAAAAAQALLRPRAAPSPAPAPPPRWRAGWLAGAVVALLAGCAIALLRDLAGAPVTQIDAQNFQVPIVARWLQEQSLWGLHQYIPDYSNATYPMHGNLLVTAFVLPFDSAFLARLVAAPYWALMGIAVYAVARELGAPRSAAVLAGAAVAALPVSIRLGLEGVQTDAPMLAFLATGALFLLRHRRDGRPAELMLGALALGLAFGTKWYAVTSVPAVVLVWALASRGRVAGDLLRIVAVIGLSGGVWLLRNWVQTGNPVFPQPLWPFDAPPDPLRDLGGFTIADYLLEWPVLADYVLPAFAGSFGWTGAALVAGAALAVALRPPRRVVAVLAGTVLLAALYVVTPYSAFGPEGRPVLTGANTRYGLPALLGAAVLAAWSAGRLPPRARVLAEALLALAVLDGIRRGFAELSAADVAGGTLVAVVVAGVFLGRLHARPRVALALAAATVAGGLVAVDAVRRRANDTGYGRFDPTLAWIERHAPRGHRVGIAGTWSTDGVSPVLPAFGPRLGNEVRYVGEFREGMLRSLAGEPARFRARLRAFDLLVVGRGAPPTGVAVEELHARAAGWLPVVASERLALWRAP